MASKVYVARETPIVWSDTAGDLVMTLKNLAANTGRVGARKDFGAGSTAYHFEWRLTVQFETQPVVGQIVEAHLAWSDGTEEDGQIGIADGALSSKNKLRNLKLIGHLIVDVATVDIDFTASGICVIPTRYVSPVIYNECADNLQDTNDTSEFTLTPIPFESQ